MHVHISALSVSLRVRVWEYQGYMPVWLDTHVCGCAHGHGWIHDTLHTHTHARTHTRTQRQKYGSDRMRFELNKHKNRTKSKLHSILYCQKSWKHPNTSMHMHMHTHIHAHSNMQCSNNKIDAHIDVLELFAVSRNKNTE